MTVENLLCSANDNAHGHSCEIWLLASDLTPEILIKALIPKPQDAPGKACVLAVKAVLGRGESGAADHAAIGAESVPGSLDVERRSSLFDGDQRGDLLVNRPWPAEGAVPGGMVWRPAESKADERAPGARIGPY